MIAGAAILAVGAAAVKMAADFDKAMGEVGTLMDLSDKEFAALKDDVLDLASTMGVDATQAAAALYQAISAGVPKDNAVAFLAEASKLAIGGVTDLQTAVDGMTTVLNAFQLEADETSHVADVLFAGVQAGKTTVDELSASLFNVAPIAAAAGVSFEETTAAVAALTTAGVPTAQATTQIRAAIQGLLKPSAEMASIFEDAGFASAQLAIEELGLVGALGVVTDAADGNIGELTKLLGSVEGVGAALSLTGAQADTFASTFETMTTTSGQAQTAFDKMNQTTARQYEMFKSKLNVVLIRLGSALLPVVNQAMTALVPVIDAVSRALDPLIFYVRNLISLFTTGKTIDEWDSAVAGLSPTLQEIGLAIQTVAKFIHDDFVPAFKSGISVIVDAVSAFLGFAESVIGKKAMIIAAVAAIGVAIALALGPVGVAAIAITGFIALLGVIRDNWDELKAKADQVWADIAAAIEPIMPFIEGVVAHLTEQVNGIIQVFEGIVTSIEGVVALVKAVFEGDWAAAWEALKQIATGAVDTMIGSLRALLGNLPSLFLDFLGMAKDVAVSQAEKIVNAIISEIEKLPGRLLELGKLIVQKFQEGLSSLVPKIPTPSLPSISIPGVGGLPGLQHGGPIYPGEVRLVGERGPELFASNVGGRVVPMGQAGNVLGGNGGVSVNIGHVTVNGSRDVRRLGGDIGFGLQRELRSRGIA